MPYIRTDETVRWSVGNPIVACGLTENGLTLTSLQLDYSDDELEWIEAVEGIAGSYNPLPDTGWVEAEEAFGHDGDIVVVRLSHARDGSEPSGSHNKYIVKGQSSVDWIAGEIIHKGLKRWYPGTMYKCILSHTTATGLEPPNAPTHWQEK